MGDWFRTARRAAAMEFGRRHHKGFAAFEVAKRALPAAAVVAVLGGLWWMALRGWAWSTREVSSWDMGWVSAAAPTVVGVCVLAAVVAVLVWAARRWMWFLDMFMPLEYGAAWTVGAVVVMVGGTGAVVWWAVT